MRIDSFIKTLGGLLLALMLAVQPTSAIAAGTGTGTHNAAGTYTWNSTTGVLTFNWTSTDFICDGPTQLGPDPDGQTGVTITATTMIWPADQSTWTRASGAAGDIVGTWTTSEGTTGNSWTATFNANGTGSVTGVIVQCGGGSGGQNPSADSQHWSSGYSVQFRYSDPNKTASAVTVAGPGITGSAALAYNTNYGSWDSWSSNNWVSFGTAPPTGLPFTYTFNITEAGATRTATSAVSCFQTQFATNLSPTGSVSGSPTFSWTGIAGAGAVYGLELNDSNGNRIWQNYNISGTSIAYGGPALTMGRMYNFLVNVSNTSACSNGVSFAQGSFTYGTGSGGSDTTAPTVPTNVNAHGMGPTAVELSWTASTDNVGVTYYKVFRNGVAAGTPQGPNNTFWPDNQVSDGNTYTYTVAACDAAGNCSAQSGSVTFTIQTGSSTSSTMTSTSTTTTTSSTTSTTLGDGTTATLVPGWNLVGNSSSGTIDVATAFGDRTKVTTVWKWIASTSKWAFYAPSLTDGGAAYATGKGYDFLTSISGGQGFWVNAGAGFSLPLPTGSAITSASFQLMGSGWNLIAIGDGKTPSAFNKALSLEPPSPGVIPVNLTTLWAWDANQLNWYFYAPSLEANSGLAAYITSKSYLNFDTKALGATTGFWVNKP